MRIALLLVPVLACAPAERVGTTGPAAPVIEMPGPSPGRGLAAVRENAGCVDCHRDVAAEWQGSLHAQAYVEPAYQRALEIEPFPFCRTCHAPEGDPTAPVPEPIASLGVSCVSCHVSGGRILAAPGSGGDERAPHPIQREPRFATALACASCHEFPFPDAVLRDQPLAMQATVSEHRRSAHAGEPCASCHMPKTGRRRSHVFSASRDPAMLRSAASLFATRLDERRVRITLTPARVGHAFPTGDLFRRIEVSAEALGPELSRAAGSERYLARHFVTERRGSLALRQLSHDDRVGAEGPEPRVVELDLGAGATGRPIAWRVAYQRVAHPLSIDSDEALLEGEVVLGSGMLEVKP